MQDFKDKIVLVTGGATGIGRAAALAFGRRGAMVVMAGRRAALGETAVAALAEIGAAGRFIRTDVPRTDDLASLHQTIAADYGRLDIAFNNAGYQEPRALLAAQDVALYDRVFDTNVRAMEYAEKGVRINAVAPGRVVTDMMLASRIMDMQAVAAGLPLRRMGQPEEVAEAAVWLASDAASFVVGHVLCIDGGFMAL